MTYRWILTCSLCSKNTLESICGHLQIPVVAKRTKGLGVAFLGLIR
jgi:hypothetical protein